MSIPAYVPPVDHYVSVSVVSIKVPFNKQKFELDCSEEYISKIETCFDKMTETDFIIFPEYSYCNSLKPLFKKFSKSLNAIIIGGSTIITKKTVGKLPLVVLA